MSQETQKFFDNLCAKYPEYNQVDPKSYENENIKRGLRNADGTGVLAGVTRIGTAQGYYVEDGVRRDMEGRLIYRGYDIRDLVAGSVEDDRFGFEETIYLLLCGVLPDSNQLSVLNSVINEMCALPAKFTEDMILRAPSRDIMNKLARAVLALYSYDDNPDDITLSNMINQSFSLIARSPMIVAHAYAAKRHYFDKESLVLHFPKDNLSLAENFLYTLRQDGKYTPEEARLLDICLVLHAEHGGGNNSTFSCRTVTSSHTDTYSAIAAAIGSLKGPKHGGANIKVMQMFEGIKEGVKKWDDDDEISAFLEKIVLKKVCDRSGLIYGMGHAVYTLSDPRSILLKKYAKDLAPRHGKLEEFQLLESVERLAPAAFAKIKGNTKTISANVDMYSGLVYEMLGIPPELYTPIFAVARMVGWCAHRIEEALYGGRIIRPGYRALSPQKAYSPLEDR
ncbi:MAG: citrate/2-methylcitrate synthase [Oscillospiraceae bacterium]|nr:citrate/2-methylcitrate synthase [Oscillospiraceae bacterium]